MTTTTTALQERVIKDIASGNTAMRPRWHFAVQTALIITASAFVFLVVLYLVSLLFFVLTRSGIIGAPRFGFAGVRIFFISLPWMLLLVAALFLLMLEMLVQKSPLSYRRPLLVSAVGLGVLVIASSVVVAFTPLHPALLHRAQRNELPGAGSIYRWYTIDHFPRAHPGIMREVRPQGFWMESHRGDFIDIVVTPTTRLPQDALMIGDTLIVFGEQSGASVSAVGIRKTSPNDFLFPKRGERKK